MKEPAHALDVLISVPGSFMLLGEHAVLRGHAALVAAVQQRVTVRLQARVDDVVSMHSALGSCEMHVRSIASERPFHFAGAAIRAAGGRALPGGFTLSIEADMPPDVGLGSSAAVTVAIYAAVYAFVHGFIPPKAILWRTCRDIIRAVQGRGSGADVAASVYGGVVLYQQEAGLLEHFTRHLPDVTLFYVGYKTPTAAVIEVVETFRSQAPDVFAALDARMSLATETAAAAMRIADRPALGAALRNGQDVMRAYGVCDEKLDLLLEKLLQQKGVLGAKISGSGLGDCVLALGKVEAPEQIPFQQIPAAIAEQGIHMELQ